MPCRMINSPMRKLAPFAGLVALACTLATPPATVPPQEPQPAGVHGLTLEEEGQVLALEDRREFDRAFAAAWMVNPNAPHRARLAMALAHIGPLVFDDANGNGVRDNGEKQAGVDELITLAGDADSGVRTQVAFALGEIGDPAGAEALFQLATDANATVAAEAAEALSKMGKSIPLDRYAALTTGADGPRGRAIRYLFRFDSDAASALAADALDTASAPLRQEAAYALSRRAYAPARERLELLVADPNVLTRAYAIAALGRIAASESGLAVSNALGDAHPWVRTNAAVALARIAAKDPTVLKGSDIPRLLALTEDPDSSARAATVDLLGFFATRNESARKRLLGIAANGSRSERELAVGALARHFGDTEVGMIPADLSDWAKVRVIEAAGQLQKNGATLRSRFFSDPSPMVRANAIGAIPDDAVDQQMDAIRRALNDDDAIVRANAVSRYSLSRTEPAEVKLANLRAEEERGRNDRENDVRLAAIAAIASLEHEGRDAYLRALLADSDLVVRRTAADLIESELKLPRPQYTPLPVTRSAAEYQAIAEWARRPHTATIHLTRGAISMALLSQDAPLTTWNFAQLAGKKYFDDTTFMRVVPNFVVQGGDPRNDQNGGPGYSIRDEINLQKYTRGAVGMALSGPDTGGSQFFITHSAQPHLDGGYTVFGRVFEGMTGVVDQIERGDKVETITVE